MHIPQRLIRSMGLKIEYICGNIEILIEIKPNEHTSLKNIWPNFDQIVIRGVSHCPLLACYLKSVLINHHVVLVRTNVSTSAQSNIKMR